MSETETGNSNEFILKAAERLRKKRLSRTEAETMSLINELEARRVQLDMHKALMPENGKTKSEIEKLISIYELAPTGYFILDTNCIISSINLRGASMLGKDRAALLKSNFRDLIMKECITDFETFLKKLDESSTISDCSIWILKEDSHILLQVEGVKSFRENTYLLTAVDITERELAQKKIKDSELRYRRLFESSVVGVLILDGTDGRVLDVNTFLADLLGYTHEEIIGKNLWELGVVTNLDEAKAAYSELREKGFIHFNDVPINTKDGKRLFVEIAGNMFDAGKEKVIEMNFHDVTQRRIAEEKLREDEVRLNELNATKDKFFSIIAHDLKSSFNSIIGLGNLLAEKARKKDYGEMEAFADIIQSSSWNAMNLLTNLLEWSRAQTGRIEFKPRHFGIIDLISEVCELMKPSAAEKFISISVEDPQNAVVFGDWEMIGTVLRNLLSNSIKFTRIYGRIMISVIQDEDEATIMVSDNGIGMGEDVIGKLFRIEESFSTEGTSGEKGTGMGLLLCKDFVGRHGGKIWAESKPDEGTRFIFTLPEKVAYQHSNS